MGASRLDAAVERIGRAIARLEAAADAPPPAPAAPAQDDGALRAKVEEAIERIDSLLATAEQD